MLLLETIHEKNSKQIPIYIQITDFFPLKAAHLVPMALTAMQPVASVGRAHTVTMLQGSVLRAVWMAIHHGDVTCVRF